MARPGIRSLPGGGHALRIGDGERALLRGLCADLRELVSEGDEAVARLFPAAYPDDPRANEEYEQLVRGGLVSGRVAALATVEATAEAEQLSEEEAEAWCGALNDLRLVLGERLGVTEELYEIGIDPRDPRAPELALYGWLTWLQGELVESLASRLPPSSGVDDG